MVISMHCYFCKCEIKYVAKSRHCHLSRKMHCRDRLGIPQLGSIGSVFNFRVSRSTTILPGGSSNLNLVIKLDNGTKVDSLILDPGSTSQFFTTIDCNTSTLMFDVNDDGLVDDTDLNYLVISIINENTLDILGDVNFDQNIDIFDLLTLSDYLN